jgi:hypothetical protein
MREPYQYPGENDLPWWVVPLVLVVFFALLWLASGIYWALATSSSS